MTGRLRQIYENAATGAVATFAYDNPGRLQNATVSGAVTTFGYDGVSRLANLTQNLVGTASDNTQTFGYNPASQMTRRTASNDAYTINSAYNVNRGYSVNGLNQYTAAGPASFLYDANGNLRSDGTNSYVYDSENRLVSAVTGGVTTTLSYDPLGRLFRVARGGTGTDFLHDGDELVAEYGGTALLRRYLHGIRADDPVLWYEGAGLTQRRSLLANHQGSIVAVGDAGGNRIAINGYDAWGIPNSGNQGRFQYTGQIWLAELGMYHYKARLYSPTLGRFLQTDPVGYDGGINLYAYVGNDPVNRVDPTGEHCLGISSGSTIARYEGLCPLPGAEDFLAGRMSDPNSKISETDEELHRNGEVIHVRLADKDTRGRDFTGGRSELQSDGRTAVVTLDPNENVLVDGRDSRNGRPVSDYSQSLEETAEHEIAGEARHMLRHGNRDSWVAAIQAENSYRAQRGHWFRRENHDGERGRGPARRWPWQP